MIVLHCFGEELKRRICQLCNLCAEWSLSLETQCSCLAGDGGEFQDLKFSRCLERCPRVFSIASDGIYEDETLKSESLAVAANNTFITASESAKSVNLGQSVHSAYDVADLVDDRKTSDLGLSCNRCSLQDIRSLSNLIVHYRDRHQPEPGVDSQASAQLHFQRRQPVLDDCRDGFTTDEQSLHGCDNSVHEPSKRSIAGEVSPRETAKLATKTNIRSIVRSVASWACTVCSETFSTQSARRTHVKRVHSGQSEKGECRMAEKLSCRLCMETFKTKLNLSNHLATNHKDHGQSNKPEKHDLETRSTRGHSDSSNSTVIDVSITQHAADVSGTVQMEGVELESKNNPETRDSVELTDPVNTDSSDGQPAGTDTKAFPVETLASRELLAVAQCQVQTPTDSGQPSSTSADATAAAAAAEHNARLRQKWQQKYPNRTIVPHECNTCGQQFMQAVQLRKHMIRHIEQESTTLACEIEFPYTCCVCTRHFLFANDLKRHLISHSDDRPHQCKVCQRQFKRDDDLTKHMKMHGDVRPYVCEICSDSFESSTRLRKHVRRVHGNRYVCNVCGQRFAKRSLLGYHNHVYHGDSNGDNNSAKPYICDQCGKAFAVETDLRTHMYANHARRRTPLHSCRWCRRQFSSVSHLASHERTHTGDRPYTCDLCGKQFTQSGSLNVHKRTHTEPQPFACNQCGQRFASKQYAKKHMAMRHGVT